MRGKRPVCHLCSAHYGRLTQSCSDGSNILLPTFVHQWYDVFVRTTLHQFGECANKILRDDGTHDRHH